MNTWGGGGGGGGGHLELDKPGPQEQSKVCTYIVHVAWGREVSSERSVVTECVLPWATVVSTADCLQGTLA